MILNKLLIKIIRIYQLCFSPFLPKTCRFDPSCSTYCIQALLKFNVIKATFLSIRRIFRCSSLSKGGCDPLP